MMIFYDNSKVASSFQSDSYRHACCVFSYRYIQLVFWFPLKIILVLKTRYLSLITAPGQLSERNCQKVNFSQLFAIYTHITKSD